MTPPLSIPIYYSLELTPFCNNRCPGCSNVFRRERAPISVSGWQQIFAHIAPHAHSLKLTGGEPTLHPKFEVILKTLAALNIPYTLFTNACWVKPERLITLLQSNQCGGLLISLHGHKAESHEAFTNQPGSFAETIKNIRQVTKTRLRVNLSTVITRWNWNRIYEIAELGQELGACYIVFNRYIGPERLQIEPDNDQLMTAIAKIESLRCEGEPVKFGNCIPPCFITNSSKGCWAGTAYCTIDPWGNLRPCNHSPLIVGNVLEQSIEVLWQSEKMNTWRALSPNECRQCSEFSVCRGGCKAMIEIRQLARDPLATNPIKNENSTPREIVFFEGAYPTLSCTVKPDYFGYALIKGISFYTIPESAKAFLDMLNGHNTLAEILNVFGQGALDLTGVLYEQGLVELHQ
jgi:radical SAM protein with 4Fe4S-binding SPASM domain